MVASAKTRKGIRRARQPVVAGQQRHADKGSREQRCEGEPILQDRKDLLVCCVRGLELAGFAVEHGYEGVRREG